MNIVTPLVALSGFAVGVGTESVIDINLYSVTWVLLLALVMALLWRRASFACPTPQLALVSVFLLTLALGLLRTQFYEQQFINPLADDLGSEVAFYGQVIKEPDRRTQLQLLQVSYQDTVIQVSTDNYVPVSYGDVITVTGKLEAHEAFTTDLGRTFDYKKYLMAKGVEYTVSFADVTVKDSGGGNVFIKNLLAAKQFFMSNLDQVLTEPAGSLADGLLLGLNQGLGDKLEEDFRRSGIIHIVVLSGYNIMLVVTFVLFLLSFFLREKWRMIVGLLAIACFALVVGLSATVVRASIMAGLLLVAQTVGRQYDVLRALLFAGFMMILINPYLLLFDIGFQLSFMATLGLIAALPWLGDKEQPEVLTSVKGYVVATIATQIAVLPLLVYHIGQVSLVSVPVNVLVLPAVPFAMLGSFLAGLLYMFVPAVGLALGAVTQLLLNYIIILAEWFSALSISVIEFSELSAWWIGCMYGLIGFLYWWFIVRSSQEINTVGDWQVIEEDELKVGTDQRSVPTKDTIPKLFR